MEGVKKHDKIISLKNTLRDYNWSKTIHVMTRLIYLNCFKNFMKKERQY
jgi:hypothetical protein